MRSSKQTMLWYCSTMTSQLDRLKRVALAGVVVVLSSCSASSRNDATSPGEQDASRQSGHQTLPSEAIQASEDRILALGGQLVDREIAKCMTSAGFEYPTGQSIGLPPSLSRRRYGLESSAEAEEFGYKQPPGASAEAPQATVSSQSDLPEFNAELYGSEEKTLTTQVKTADGVLVVRVPDGCAGEGYASVYGSREAYLDAVAALTRARQIDTESYNFLLASAQYESIRAAWEACMVDAGESRFGDPTEPLGFDWTSPEEERSVALKDVTCKEKVEFVSKAAGVELAWQTENFDRFRGDAEVAEQWAKQIEEKAQSTI